MSFSVLRFLVFFVRGNVDPVSLGLKNGQVTALFLLTVALVALLVAQSRRPGTAHNQAKPGPSVDVNHQFARLSC